MLCLSCPPGQDKIYVMFVLTSRAGQDLCYVCPDQQKKKLCYKLCRNGYPTWGVGQDNNFRPREEKKHPALGAAPLRRDCFYPPSGGNYCPALPPM